MSVGQLAALPPAQKAEISRNLDEALAWLKQARAKFDAALEAAYGEQARAARLEAGKDFGVVHLKDGLLRVTVDVPKRVSWDQAQLAAIAPAHRRRRREGRGTTSTSSSRFPSPTDRKFNRMRPSMARVFGPRNTFGQGRLSARLPLNGKSLGRQYAFGPGARAAASPQRWIPPLHWVTN
jgi:hypothetical protein